MVNFVRKNVDSKVKNEVIIMSLYRMTQPSIASQVMKKIEGEKYCWKELYSQETIRKIHSDRSHESVDLDTSRCMLGYASEVVEFHEAWLYPEGDLLVCVTASEFAGTLASHDDISVKYFHLTLNEDWKDTRRIGGQYYVQRIY